jgi:5-methylcytosine-specific restriction enzyme subunit McrC
MPDRSGEGPSWFRDVLSDDNYMDAVFEEFIRNFYSMKQSYFTVGRSHPKWNATAEDRDLLFLPAMTTDVTLSSASRMIIIDAKYYRDALQTHTLHGTRKVYSSHLYQLLAYLHGTTKTRDDQIVEGMLVYPVGEQAVDLRFKIDAYSVRIYTLNLAQPWYSIESDLLNLIDPPTGPYASSVGVAEVP